MSATQRILLTGAALTLAACASVRDRGPGDGIARVNPASVAASPAAWDGHQVEMVGLLVWESEDLGLYQSYGAYCRGAEQAAISVAWPGWQGVSRADSRRRVVVRGIFHNRVGAKQLDGSIMVSTGAPGPGPLEPGGVVRWLSPRLKPCPAARP
jgi:hypothetical protein